MRTEDKQRHDLTAVKRGDEVNHIASPFRTDLLVDEREDENEIIETWEVLGTGSREYCCADAIAYIENNPDTLIQLWEYDSEHARWVQRERFSKEMLEREEKRVAEEAERAADIDTHPEIPTSPMPNIPAGKVPPLPPLPERHEDIRETLFTWEESQAFARVASIIESLDRRERRNVLLMIEAAYI